MPPVPVQTGSSPRTTSTKDGYDHEQGRIPLFCFESRPVSRKSLCEQNSAWQVFPGALYHVSKSLTSCPSFTTNRSKTWASWALSSHSVGPFEPLPFRSPVLCVKCSQWMPETSLDHGVLISCKTSRISVPGPFQPPPQPRQSFACGRRSSALEGCFFAAIAEKANGWERLS